MESEQFRYDNTTKASGGIIMSVQKARRILGPLCKSMDDTQVKEIIMSLHLLAKEQLIYNGSNHESAESSTSRP
jgi:hypothetical protein cdiviTM7_00950